MIHSIDPKLIPKNKPIKTVSQKFSGLNKNTVIQKGEFSSTTNLSTDNLPCMCPRPSREAISTIINPYGMGSTDTKLFWVSGTDFYYDGTKKNGSTALTASIKNMFVFKTKIIIFPDLMYYDYVDNEFGKMNPLYQSGASQITYKNVIQSVTDGSTVTFASDRITISGTIWKTEFAAGDTIKITGNIAYPENEGYFTVVECVSATVLRFAANTFTAGTELATTSLSFGFSSITTTGIDFSGFASGDYVTISDNTTKVLNNKDVALVTGVSNKVISFDYGELVASSGAVAEQITIKIDVPAMDYGCVHNNRIWGVKGDNLYASGSGKHNLFKPYAIDNTTLDFAYVTTTGTKGSFTGIKSYNGVIVADKQGKRFEVYNNNPPYRVNCIVEEEGSENHKALCEFKGRLYALNSKNGITSYGGSYPQPESYALNETYVSAVCGTDNKKLYCSLYNGSSYNLYVLDQNGIWMREDSLNVIDFTFMGGYLYALASTGVIYKFNSGNESISSEGILDVDTYDVYFKKYITAVNIRLEVTSGTVTVYGKLDNGSYVSLKAITATGLTAYKMKITPPKRCDHYTIKITGTGSYKIHDIGTDVIQGGSV